MSSTASSTLFARQPADLSAGQRAALAAVVVASHLALGWVWWHARSAVEVAPVGEVIEVSLVADQPVERAVPTEAPRQLTQPEPVRATAKPQVVQAPQPQAAARPVATQATQAPPLLTSHTGAEAAAAAPALPVNATAAPQAAPATAAAPAPAPPAAPVEVHVSKVAYLVPPVLTFPPASFALGEQGTVLLRVLVDEQGRPIEILVAKSSGYPRLDQRAVQAMRAARFKPHLVDGVPHRMWAPAPQRFILEDN